ncbi:hypothetical protein LTR78_006473 [Recurvomyces mirabilis]|uniref:Uncharacterized protein n=1 Tax=Recurvomyces mirabilis TaxID=574656 RepID=A0AAE1C007_9PEZI|nr:hypothetical protein LTR78_006473 [Recurvomyces mirabilis]KAK5151108.1 hypothetical protein LTS14_009604 [Recurvomyces mirabilis]
MASATPTKERTPASDATATKTATANNSGITFTDKEERVLKVAWSCLKGGAPEIDIAKLVELGGFNTAKTAANTWGVIKKKLAAIGVANATPKTPKTPKAKATPKKRTKKSEEEGDDDEGAAADEASPKRKRKTPIKKAAKKEDSPMGEGEEVMGVKGEVMEE